MGKIKRARQKFHHKSPLCSSEKPLQQAEEQCENPEIKMYNENEMMQQATFSSNLFSNINITASMLKQQLPPASIDTASVRSYKSVTSQLTKREKRQMKHNLFLEKINAIQASRNKKMEKLKRQKTPIVGDLKPLEDALPTLDLLIKENKHTQKKNPIKPVSSRSEHSRQKTMMDDIAMFRQVVNDASFKADPFGSVKTHLKYKFQNEMQDS